MKFRIHWLAVTIHCSLDHALALWDIWFAPFLGALQLSGHGAQGFRKLYKSLAMARLYGDPAGYSDQDEVKEYIHLELPGQACDAVPLDDFREFFMELQRHYKFSVTRVDLAWDGVPFTPEQVREAIEFEQVRTNAARKTMTFTTSMFEEREDGEIGTSSLRLGSLTSNRLLRVYDKRGPVRLELLTRKDRATMICIEALTQKVDQWAFLALAHLRDYIDFVDKETKKLLPWWEEFVDEVARANRRVTDAKQKELERMLDWVDSQVSCTLSVLHDVYGENLISLLIKHGRQKRGNRYDAILAHARIEEKDE